MMQYFSVLLLISISVAYGLNSELIINCGKDADDSADNVQSLLARGADANALTSDGESVLHLACIYGDPKKVEHLLNAGANPNYRAEKNPTSLSMTPLSWCVYGGYTEATRTFLEDQRTDVNLVVYQEDGNYLTALDIAMKIGDMGHDIATLLSAGGGKTWAQLLEASGGDASQVPGMP